MRRPIAVALFLLAVVPTPALAQKSPPRRTKTERGSLFINGGYLLGTSEIQSKVAVTVNAESGSFTSKFKAKDGPAVDVGGRVRVWKHLGAGAAFTRFTDSSDSNISAQIPHPFFFSTMRAADGTAPSQRQETAVHVRAVVTSPPGRKLQYSGFAGPAFFSVRQTLVDHISYSESYPFDTVTFTSASTRTVTASKVAVGLGADVAYYFSKKIGVGLSATYAKASLDLKAVDNSTVAITVGGAIVGLGVRVRF
jgi:hypothetical protein